MQCVEVKPLVNGPQAVESLTPITEERRVSQDTFKNFTCFSAGRNHFHSYTASNSAGMWREFIYNNLPVSKLSH